MPEDLSTYEYILTPSKISAWLDCGHYLTLRKRLDAGLLDVELSHFGDFAKLLMDKGQVHELDCLAQYRLDGKDICEVPARTKGEPFAGWVNRVGSPWEDGPDVIYQMPFLHDGVRGIADFLIRVDDPVAKTWTYEPVDAKLTRVEAKPGHVLQLCFYADALEAATGFSPEKIHIWLGSGRVESLIAQDFQPYWRRLRSQLQVLFQDEGSPHETTPEPCPHCAFCEFAVVCNQEWRGEDSLIFVANIRPIDRSEMVGFGIETLGELATCTEPIGTIRPERLARLVNQAALQVEARNEPDAPLPFYLIPADEDQTWGRGLELLPEPDEGDVFLDFEGHPFWTADRGLFFLFGFIMSDSKGSWTYRALWAHDVPGEKQATAALVDFLLARRADYPDMHVYHYNHTERSALEHLVAEHGVAELALTELVETGLFVDLYQVVRNAVQVGTESYGLKHLERLAGYQRSHEIDSGSGAVVEYEAFMMTHDAALLDAIAAYNEDDVRATRALRDWLVGLRPQDLNWRASRLDPGEEWPELDAQVAALHAFGSGTPEHLLGDLLGYWLRERQANKAPKVAKSLLDTSALLEDLEVIAGLEYCGIEQRLGKNGRELTPGARFRWPDQEIAADFTRTGASVLYGTPEGPTGYASVADIDTANRELLLLWNERAVELGHIPKSVALDDWVSPKPKPEALAALATKMLDPAGSGDPNPSSVALLRRLQPAFTAGGGPPDGLFTDTLDEMTKWVTQLDGSFIAIQGPPGTGKTYWGAHIVHALIEKDLRVGISAMSHHAIDNLLEEIVDVFNEKGAIGKLKAVRRVPRHPGSSSPNIEYATGNAPCAKADFNLVAGTTWLFAGKEMASAPVDVLIIDEAGQLALADALAASGSAKNLVLLGDPLQLPQVAQAAHPGDGGLSVLEHVLGGEVTLPTDRGVFLTETRRMHPDVCRFISEQIYEGRLESHPSCAIQDTEFGTGLRWLPAHHVNCATESPEEAEIVVDQIDHMLGSVWTNQKGVTGPLTVQDFMVVAPYNDQVALLREVLDANESTRGVPVGTVDKFQGREAAVVLFTMTTSAADFIPRGASFLFSRNRLNVAISRARCLAYLVCTDELLNSRARSIEEMRLISTLCAFVEYANDAE